jgi:hypothetical protein
LVAVSILYYPTNKQTNPQAKREGEIIDLAI